MSAAEKLRALDVQLERQRLLGTMNYYFGPGARTAVSRESVQMYRDAKTVLDALPQIVALVEAAERLRLALRNDPRIAEQSFGVQSAKPPFDAALAALDDALGAVT